MYICIYIYIYMCLSNSMVHVKEHNIACVSVLMCALLCPYVTVDCAYVLMSLVLLRLASDVH